jgi:hypothetical protein
MEPGVAARSARPPRGALSEGAWGHGGEASPGQDGARRKPVRLAGWTDLVRFLRHDAAGGVQDRRWLRASFYGPLRQPGSDAARRSRCHGHTTRRSGYPGVRRPRFPCCLPWSSRRGHGAASVLPSVSPSGRSLGWSRGPRPSPPHTPVPQTQRHPGKRRYREAPKRRSRGAARSGNEPQSHHPHHPRCRCTRASGRSRSDEEAGERARKEHTSGEAVDPDGATLVLEHQHNSHRDRLTNGPR